MLLFSVKMLPSLSATGVSAFLVKKAIIPLYATSSISLTPPNLPFTVAKTKVLYNPLRPGKPNTISLVATLLVHDQIIPPEIPDKNPPEFPRNPDSSPPAFPPEVPEFPKAPEIETVPPEIITQPPDSPEIPIPGPGPDHPVPPTTTPPPPPDRLPPRFPPDPDILPAPSRPPPDVQPPPDVSAEIKPPPRT